MSNIERKRYKQLEFVEETETDVEQIEQSATNEEENVAPVETEEN